MTLFPLISFIVEVLFLLLDVDNIVYYMSIKYVIVEAISVIFSNFQYSNTEAQNAQHSSGTD